MTQKFVKGDIVICIINSFVNDVELGKCYTILDCSFDLVRVEGTVFAYHASRFRLATPLNKALV